MLDDVNRRQRLPQATTTGNSIMATINLRIKGMSCASCANRIERALQNNFSAIDCQVNFATEKATINYNTQEISLEKIRETITKIGFKVEEINPQKKTRSPLLKEKKNKIYSNLKTR
jgi:P-type Cu+ transporter